jgi:hypothetical protein
LADERRTHGLPDWSEQEFRLLIELFLEWEGRPPQEAIENLSLRLREMNPELAQETRSYRSVGSVGQHLYYLQLLARGDPRSEQAPATLREIWVESEPARPSLLITEPMVAVGAEEDRLAIIEALQQLRYALDRTFREGSEWFPPDTHEAHRAA